MFTYHKSVAATNVSFSYSSIELKHHTQLVVGRSTFYITDEYLC